MSVLSERAEQPGDLDAEMDQYTARSESALEPNVHRAMLAVMTISKATDLWVGELRRMNKAESTIDRYRRLLDKLADRHEHQDVQEISAVHIRRFLDYRATNAGGRKAASTIGGDVSCICMFFDWMTREGIIDRNPTRRNGDRIIQRPKQIAPEENDNVVTVSGDDVRLLLHESLRGKRWDEALAIHCLVYLGPRRKALALVRLRDYDPDERTITFIEKGSKTITKPVPDTLADLIDAAIAYRDPEGEPLYMDPADYLIPSGAEQRRPGNRDDRIIWKIVRRVAYRAEVKTHVHALRAAFAVAFLEQYPGDLVALQNLMGHARMETTLVYLRRLNRRQRMETVRGLSWDAPGFPQSAVEPLHVPDGTEKEGFEPSFSAESGAGRVGTRSADDAPGETA